jgi:hypothetical protein
MADMNGQEVVVQISWVLGVERIRTLAAIPLTLIPVLIREFHLFPRDAPNDEFLWWPREKKGLCGGVDGVDVFYDIRGGKKRARVSEGSEGDAIQLEKFHLRQLALWI